MSRQIMIDPVTRIEGHSKITIQLDDHGMVEDAHLHVTQFRGFEKLCEGRPFYEMPSLMARICGICPVSHLLASAKACDEIMGVSIPETANSLRRILNLSQIIQSHALSFFYLSSPDFLLGMDSDPATRNIFTLLNTHPELVKDGVALRQFGQKIIEMLGEKRIHPAWVVPGGVNEPLSEEERDTILEMIPDALTRIRRTLDWYKGTLENYREEIRSFANFPSLFMGLIASDNGFSHYKGRLRVIDSSGNILVDGADPRKYTDYIEEAVEPYSYLKFPYYKPMGYPGGLYRVGPLARLNVIDHCGTPMADQEWSEFRGLQRGAVTSSFYYHYARLIEILYGIERIHERLCDPTILDKHVRAFAAPNNSEGVGVTEAPRGILFHHYKVDERGLITWANLIIATGHNNLAMNKGVLQVARHFIKGTKIEEGMLNRVEAVVRCYDPCLSCSTHAQGDLPLLIELRGAEGELLDTVHN